MDFKAKDKTSDKAKKGEREICKYGSECYQKNPFHMAKFRHPKKPSEEQPVSKRRRLEQDPELGECEYNCEESTGVESASNNHQISDSEGEENCDKCDKVTGESDRIVVASLKGDVKQKLKHLYYVRFPDDFFAFYDFCKSVYSKNPKTSLRDIDLELVGPFDVLSGLVESCTSSDIIRHYRYFYDPPEFYTVLKSTESDFHFGYYFDEPDQPPSFVGSNDPAENCVIKIVAPNIFACVNSYITDFLKKCSPFNKVKVQKLQTRLTKWAKENNWGLETNPLSLKQRNSKVNTKTFNGAGIVVPYNKETDVGYRPLAENDKSLRDLFAKIVNSDGESERKARWSKIEHIITYAMIAADECDFGATLELGVDMFCQPHPCFSNTAKLLMCTAYDLLGRSHFSKVATTHLQHRVQGANVNFATRT